ncbi:MAG: pantoate--beta-alanine ligase, partial [Nitrospirota bacterium]
MRVIRSVRALQNWRRRQLSTKGTIGFVPTMGALHPGHLALIQRARRSCKTLVVSIFVNPLQFGPKEDLKRYPRALKRDLDLCRKNDVDVVFMPSQKDLYPNRFQTGVSQSQLMQRWEGAHRPTHLHGVATVVTKLLNLVQPGKAFFGQKDYQQYLVIDQLVKDLNLDVKIVRCATVRDQDGLAWSSRNQYLGPKQRQNATILFKALVATREAINAGQRATKVILRKSSRRIASIPNITIDYFAVCDAGTLEPVNVAKGKIVLLGAIRIGQVRLIDN